MAPVRFAHLRNQVFKFALASFCFILLALKLAVPINLAAVDIGRHVKNGEELLERRQWDVLHTNFYSFTYPDYPFINHHWFFGVMSYGVWKCFGFIGLSIAYIALMLLALFFFFRAALLRGNFPLVVFLAFAALPILADRKEIRPEGISILFMGVYFYLLTKLSLGKIRRGGVFLILFFLQVIWVNTHIFFFMGPLLVSVFLWEGANRGCKACVRSLTPLLFLTLALNIINPSGLSGAAAPLNILKEFGYRLAENQNIFFMLNFFPQEKIYIYYLAMALIAAVGIVWAVWKRGWKMNAPFAVLAIVAVCAGLKAARLMMPFGFLFIPLASFFYSQVEGKWTRHVQLKARGILLAGAVMFCVFYGWGLRGQQIGLGLVPGINRSADFFKAVGLRGPVFSNYDIGGYLIFHLADQEKVFVDNRQEAFPLEFFKNVYVPMQEEAQMWRKTDGRYGFNAIYFYRHDLTPWGQNFLIERIQDPQWVPVFVDDYVIIFLKRNSVNQPIIERFELPKSMFGVSRPGQVK